MELTISAVSRQVLNYSYQLSEAPGITGATQVARQWLEEIFQETWWPDASIRPLVHHGNAASCDAVKFTYRASDVNGALGLTIYQTLFFIVVTVVPKSAVDLSEVAIARRIFQYPERLNLIAAGHQDSAGVPYRNYDWLDTIQWWSTQNLVGFEMLKRTGPGQGTIVRPELEANRVWFAKFE